MSIFKFKPGDLVIIHQSIGNFTAGEIGLIDSIGYIIDGAPWSKLRSSDSNREGLVEDSHLSLFNKNETTIQKHSQKCDCDSRQLFNFGHEKTCPERNV